MRSVPRLQNPALPKTLYYVQVPSHKFLPLVYQIASRLGSNPQADHEDAGEAPSFQVGSSQALLGARIMIAMRVTAVIGRAQQP